MNPYISISLHVCDNTFYHQVNGGSEAGKGYDDVNLFAQQEIIIEYVFQS